MMNESPLVSVLITAYNREKFINQAIESVLRQTYVNLEIIIVDDASVDRTYEIASSYKDPRIRLFRNEENLGQFQNRNKAALLASGELLKYVDSDDLIEKKCIELFVRAFSVNKKIVFASVLYNRVLLNSELFLKEGLIALSSFDSFRFHYENGGLLFAGPTATMYKRKNFIDVGGFGCNLGINADVDLNFKLCAVGYACFITNCITWRKHDEQIDSQQSEKVKMILERYEIDIKNIENLKSLGFKSQQINLWLSFVNRLFGRHLFNFLLKLDIMNLVKFLTSKKLSWHSFKWIFFPTFLLKWRFR